MSTFDDLFFAIFGSHCTKEGEAFEKFAAAVEKLIAPRADIVHDQRLRGKISQSLYQVDVLVREKGLAIFGEAKDYSERDEKVGRPDLQKLGGALPELDVDRGRFFSATDYSKPAKAYASGAQAIVGKPIDLMHLRPTTEDDERGRIRKIILSFTVLVPNYDAANWTPIFTEAGKTTADLLDPQTRASSHAISELVDSKGHLKTTVAELTSRGFDGDHDRAYGKFDLPDHYLKAGDKLVELSALAYDIPYLKTTSIVEIEATGKPRLLVKAEDGSINKLITDDQLKRVQFNADGSIDLS